ncbi:MAG: type 4a pilus biogenesis protein PilO [Bdellovibrio sp.]|nr:type 4a pilus biogenesis protein PilO [Bdellovibrio sp.]
MKFIKLFSTLSIGRLSIFALLITVAYYFMSFNNGSTIIEQVNAVKGQIGAEQARRTDIEKTMKKEEEMRGNVLQLARNLEVLKSKIPNDFKETEMSTIVNQASQSADVRIIVLSRGSQTNTVKKMGTGAELIDEIVFDISAVGTFTQLIHFVELLSKEEKVIRTRNFSIEKNSSNVDDATIKFKGEIVGYKQVAMVAPAKPDEVRK